MQPLEHRDEPPRWHGQLDGAGLDQEPEPDFVEQPQVVAEGLVELLDGDAFPLGQLAITLDEDGQPPEQEAVQRFALVGTDREGRSHAEPLSASSSLTSSSSQASRPRR